MKKIRRNRYNDILTKRTGYIRQQTGFIRRRTGFIRRVDKASLPADGASPPTDEDSPIGPCIFFLFSLLFFQMFSVLSAAEVLPSKSALKLLFLRTYADLLNYPYKEEIKKIKFHRSF